MHESAGLPVIPLGEGWPPERVQAHNAAMGGYFPAHSRIVEAVLKASVEPGTPIVEIGSGHGYLGRLIPSPYRAGYIQTEISLGNCFRARRANPDMRTLAVSGYRLPFADASMSYVAALDVVDVLEENLLAREIRRVLQPGSKFLHLRDRRPNLGWLMHHLTGSDLVMPLTSDQGSFTAFQLIAQEDFMRLTDADRQLALQVAEPHRLDVLSDYASGALGMSEVRRVSDLIRATGRARPTLRFDELFLHFVGESFARHGIQMVRAAIIRDQTDAAVAMQCVELQKIDAESPAKN